MVYLVTQDSTGPAGVSPTSSLSCYEQIHFYRLPQSVKMDSFRAKIENSMAFHVNPQATPVSMFVMESTHVKKDLTEACSVKQELASTNVMEKRIASAREESEKRAQALYNKAMSGEITCTEAWHSLPAPVPNVESRGYYPETHYIIQYQFLNNVEAVQLRSGVEKEWRDAMRAREAIQSAIPQIHDQKVKEMKTAVETTRKTFDSYAIATADRKAHLDELRIQLAAYESAYQTCLKDFESAKQSKEIAEATHLDYTSKSAAMMRVAHEDGEAVLNRLGKYEMDNLARQKAETEEWTRMWDEHNAEVFRARDREAQEREAQYAKMKRASYIQEIAKRRLEKDYELQLESEILEAMRQMRGEK